MSSPAPLSYEQAPPFSLPLRFFLSAPLFAAAAGGLLLWEGSAVFASRWMPATLAITHLITVGFMLMVMLGGLLQVLPVVVGVQLVAVRRLGPLLHAALVVGAVLLPLAFLRGSPWMFSLAGAVLGCCVLLFLLAAWRGVLRVAQSSAAVLGIRLSLFGLGVTAALGAALALGLGAGWPLPYLALTDLHAAWGLAAWAGMLLAALSYLVVPMFQLTPAYAPRFPALMLGSVAVGVGAWSLGMVLDAAGWLTIAAAALALAGTAYAGYTLRLLAQRRRARRDSSLYFWWLGLATALPAVAMPLLAMGFPALAARSEWALAFGVLLGVGGFMSVMSGMLYKIVPFLAWLHLQDLGRARRKVPAMGALLPEAGMKRHLNCHLLAVGLLLSAVVWPVGLARVAGLALLCSGLCLFANLCGAALAYRRAAAEIAKTAAEVGDDRR